MKLEWIEIEDNDFIVVKEIYDYYILNTTVTFNTEKISISGLKKMILIGHPKYKSFVIKVDGSICGYCYFSQYRNKPAYDRTAEISVYLKPEFAGKGIGKLTIEKMEKTAIENEIKVLMGIITAENRSSIGLFEKNGFEKCGHFSKVGEKFGRILDVVVFQKIL